jgi:uncharacterized membrane protein
MIFGLIWWMEVLILAAAVSMFVVVDTIYCDAHEDAYRQKSWTSFNVFLFDLVAIAVIVLAVTDISIMQMANWSLNVIKEFAIWIPVYLVIGFVWSVYAWHLYVNHEYSNVVSEINRKLAAARNGELKEIALQHKLEVLIRQFQARNQRSVNRKSVYFDHIGVLEDFYKIDFKSYLQLDVGAHYQRITETIAFWPISVFKFLCRDVVNWIMRRIFDITKTSYRAVFIRAMNNNLKALELSNSRDDNNVDRESLSKR